MVGIVGPNGCGKSNVIDAVRWVLGESQARQLRGASMTDVIFNGSSKRKPVARASVELSFDNSDGKAPGPWAAYAEISIKRVLTRQGESVYHVNNTVVRRRDMVDIFLGTGLGAKTPYAIIEQGMISRIIEARPEELRGFLEEAAGISKYKERRRETETRLNSTRDNLARLDDIRQVLDQQITRLRDQAEIARQYLLLQDELNSAQQLSWFVKQRDAFAKCHKLDEQIAHIGRQQEAIGDELRAVEYAIVTARDALADAGAQLNAAQGEFYAAGAEVSKLEQTVRHLAETRKRLQAQTEQIERQRHVIVQQIASYRSDLSQREQRSQALRIELDESARLLTNLAAKLKQAESSAQEIRRKSAERQRDLLQAEQSGELGATKRRHVTKALQQLADRQIRLQREADGMAIEDPAEFQEYERKLTEAVALLNDINTDIAAAQERLRDLGDGRRRQRAELERLNQIIHQAEGEQAALTKVQRQMTVEAGSDAWLKQHKLDDLPRFWQRIEVEPGWEKAVETALIGHLQALVAESDILGDKDLTASGAEFVDIAVAATELGYSELPRLLDKIAIKSGGGAALQEWLQYCYIADSVAQAEIARSTLPPGGKLFIREGYVFTRYSRDYAKTATAAAGILVRQKDIEALTAWLVQTASQKAAATESLSSTEAAIGVLEQDLHDLRSRHSQTQQLIHQYQMQKTTLLQTRQRLMHRRVQIAAELAEIAGLIDSEQIELRTAEMEFQQSQKIIAQMKPDLEQIRQERQVLENDVNRHREQHRMLERKRQEMNFSIEMESSKIMDIDRSIKESEEKLNDLSQQHAALFEELAGLTDKTHGAELMLAIERRQQAERILADTRQLADEAGATLRKQEETRMKLEQSLLPLRDQLESARLKRMEADLLKQQCDDQLLSLNADPLALSDRVAAGARITGLPQEIERLSNAVATLGAVNLAAVGELEQSLERSVYLQAQAEDLQHAISTLLEVMTTIDNETRDLFKVTFDAVNQAMSELFTTLFHGGMAQLSLTGEEWLDAGVQVFAQPPGKRNSSIHLLSGGEKALTALSLVFALFKLNPAPFCILDEVDAPLDDSNTERYIRLVKHMSDQVQFIFITHNRITMEAAGQLIGVTMQESGISSTVSVDLEQASRFAETDRTVLA